MQQPLQLKENIQMTSWSCLDVFRYCRFLKLLGKIMILLVLFFVGLTYYAVVIYTYWPHRAEGQLASKAVTLLVVILFHALVSSAIYIGQQGLDHLHTLPLKPAVCAT